MNKDKGSNAIIHSTSGGRLYIEAQDFFGQDKVRKMISKLMESSIYKQIQQDKNKK